MGPDASGDAPRTTDRRSPKAARTRERGRSRQTRIPGPEKGEQVTGGPQPWERCRGGGSEATPPRRSTSDNAQRDTHGMSASRERRKRGRAGGGRTRRAGEANTSGRGTGGTREAHHLPHTAPHPFRSTSSRGDPPQNHEKSPGSKHAGMTMALAPRDPPSDSERGGAGRGRPKEHKHSGSPGDGRRGTPGQSYAHRAVGAGGRSRGTVRERTPTRPREHAPSSDR